jgi:hypothetical protein
MLHGERESRAINPRERDLVIAYLSYALDDVRALSEAGSRFLQMTIATITDATMTDEAGADGAPPPSISSH